MSDRITKPVLRVLEKCLEAEIHGMPAQFAVGSFKAEVLTHRGHVVYCERACEQEDGTDE